jgi:hypothetical protein
MISGVVPGVPVSSVNGDLPGSLPSTTRAREQLTLVAESEGVKNATVEVWGVFREGMRVLGRSSSSSPGADQTRRIEKAIRDEGLRVVLDAVAGMFLDDYTTSSARGPSIAWALDDRFDNLHRFADLGRKRRERPAAPVDTPEARKALIATDAWVDQLVAAYRDLRAAEAVPRTTADRWPCEAPQLERRVDGLRVPTWSPEQCESTPIRNAHHHATVAAAFALALRRGAWDENQKIVVEGIVRDAVRTLRDHAALIGREAA